MGKIEFRGKEMTGCMAVLVPDFVWRLVGATILLDVESIQQLHDRTEGFMNTMDSSLATQRKLIEELAKRKGVKLDPPDDK